MNYNPIEVPDATSEKVFAALHKMKQLYLNLVHFSRDSSSGLTVQVLDERKTQLGA